MSLLKSTTHVSLDLQRPNYVTVYATQNDRLSRYINAELHDGAASFAVPSGTGGVIAYRKPDGTGGLYDTLEDGSAAFAIEADGTVTIGLAEQALTVPGTVPVEIRLYLPAAGGGSRLTTWFFVLQVGPSVLEDAEIVSSDYYNVLTDKITQAQQLWTQIQAGFGAPLTSTSLEAMTDGSKVYVYVGTDDPSSTPPMVFGHWYYWDGAANQWRDGGVYQSAAVDVDATLSQTGVAADAQKTGALAAPVFSSATAYTAGQHVLYQGTLYRFTADHAAGAWIGTDAVAVNLGGEIEAVSGDVTDLTSAFNTRTDALSEHTAMNLDDQLEYKTSTHNGVTFTFADGNVTAVGTPTANAFVNLYYSATDLPFCVKPNDVLSIVYNWSGRVFVQIAFRDESSWGAAQTITYKNNNIKVPSNAVGMYIRMMVYSNRGAVNETDKLPSITKIATPDMYIGYKQYDFADKTINGISYSWDYNKNICTLTGTASGSSYSVLYDSGDSFPSGLRQGEEINVSFYTKDAHIRASLVFYDKANTMLLEKVIATPVSIIIPDTANRLVVRLVVYNGYTVNNICTTPLIIKGTYKQLFMPLSYNKRKLVSFIDDDASGNAYVWKYYQACKHNGIVGAYAVITGGYADGTLDIEQLRTIQQDGFNMIIHCADQQTYLRPTSSDYDNSRARGNYIKAIQDFNALGLINPQGMWAIPYGDTADAVLTIGMDLGFDMFFGVVGSTYNRVTDIDKHKLYRCGLVSLSEVADDTATSGGTVARAKLRIDELMADNESGWLIIMTHFNTWQNESWDSTIDSNGYETGYARFNEVVQYAKNSGAEIVSMAEGAAYMKPFYDRNMSR